jgi:Na+-transporting NADH:ubiquinone oxidoreductase subunit NqrE
VLISFLFFNNQAIADETAVLASAAKEAIPYVIGIFIILWISMAAILSIVLNFLSKQKRKLFLPILIAVSSIGSIEVLIDLNTYVFYNATPESWSIIQRLFIPNIVISFITGMITYFIISKK